VSKWISLTAGNISSLVIDWLCDQVGDRDIAVGGIYYDYLAREQQSAANILGAIPKQLLERDRISAPVRQVFGEGKKRFGRRAVRLLDFVEISSTTIASLPEVFIGIDGLNESLPKDRRELLEPLQDIALTLPTTRLFLSGIPQVGSANFVLEVATAIAIEQVGMPKLDMVNGGKRRNEFVNVEGRMEEDRKRIEDMGVYLDV